MLSRLLLFTLKAVSTNESLKEISFQRSNIYDKGCEAICNTIKYLEHVEKLNLSECELTTKGAECVADMIKVTYETCCLRFNLITF